MRSSLVTRRTGLVASPSLFTEFDFTGPGSQPGGGTLVAAGHLQRRARHPPPGGAHEVEDRLADVRRRPEPQRVLADAGGPLLGRPAEIARLDEPRHDRVDPDAALRHL